VKGETFESEDEKTITKGVIAHPNGEAHIKLRALP